MYATNIHGCLAQPHPPYLIGQHLLIHCVIQAEVLNPDKTPASGIDVVFNPGQVKGRTVANGIVRVSVDTVQNGQQLVITVSLTVGFHLDANITYKITTDLMTVLGKNRYDIMALKCVY